MRTTGWIAVGLAVAFVGIWFQSERHMALVPEEPEYFSIPANKTSATGGARGATQFAGQMRSRSISDRSQLDQKLAQNDRDLTAAQDRFNRVQDELQTADLDRQIQQQQQVVMDLQARSKSGGQQQEAAQLQNQAILTEQGFQILQQRITGLQQQIQNQQGISNLIEQQLRNTYAPDDSDIMVKLNNELRASEQHKRELQTQYDSIVQQQQQLAMNRYTNQAQQQQQQQAGAINTDVSLEQAKGRLEDLNRQKQALLNEAEQSKRRIDELQSERTSLLSQSQ